MEAVTVATKKRTGVCPLRMLGVRVRRAAGFALGLAALAVLDFLYCTWPRLTGRSGGNGQK